MADARDRCEWARAAQVSMLIVLSNPWRKQEPLNPADFNPYVKRRRPKHEFTFRDLKMVMTRKPTRKP